MKKILLVMLLAAAQFMAVRTQAADKRALKLDTDKLSMVYVVGEDSTLYFAYFGPRIDSAEEFLLKQSYRRADYGTDNMGFPTTGWRNFRQPAMRATHSDGDLNTELVVTGFKDDISADGAYRTLTVSMKDRKLPFYVNLIVTAYPGENVYTQQAVYRNGEGAQVVLHEFYSSYLPVKANSYHLTSFYGAWAQEMSVRQQELSQGIFTVDSKKGVRTTHTENPSFLVSLDGPMAEQHGHVIGGALAWSGNYRINFEVDEFDVLGITSGMNPYASEYSLAPGERLQTPEMVFTYSTEGAGGVSRNFHDWARRWVIYQPEVVRPTLLNSWEGAYFDFDEKTLKDMIDDAADIGLEMFVLDDGWFGNNHPRNHTRAGLGDWDVNAKKLPKGINDIAEYAHKKGLQFGIWIEPEMVNPNSDLAGQHPEWVVRASGRPVTTMRNQWLLDLSNPAVQDFVVGVFDRVMQTSPYISYIKWDCNRHVESAGSAFLDPSEQSKFWIKYTEGLYSVYERIRKKYPDVILQACASGGGRVDFGALRYNHEVWTSDNTDPYSRVYIQYGTNLIYPALVTGSHVSDSPNHQSGNMSTLKFRFDIAMSGRLGMELQPRDLTPEEKEFSRRAIADYKRIRDVVNYGDLYRLLSPYNSRGYYSLMYVAKDKSRAVAYLYTTKYQGRTHTPVMKLSGLDPERNYRVTELNVDKSLFWGDGRVFSGQYLINEGINHKLEKHLQSAVFLIEQAD